MSLLSHLKDVYQGKATLGQQRSPQWPKVRKEHLKLFPYCAICKGNHKVEVHHKKPFHIHPELELDPRNLISLCEAKKNGVNCHLLFGHLGDFKSVNEAISTDSKIWCIKLRNRPHLGGAKE